MHLTPDPVVDGHFNVLRGAIGGDVQRAGVKVVSGFVYNYEHGLPSEGAVLALFDPKTGKTQATLDAGGITDMLTGAVTAIGAKYLARQASKVLGHIGARGAAYWNVRLLDSLFTTTRSVSTRAAWGASARLPSGCARISARPCANAGPGGTRSSARTSWSRHPACLSRRCC